MLNEVVLLLHSDGAGVVDAGVVEVVVGAGEVVVGDDVVEVVMGADVVEVVAGAGVVEDVVEVVTGAGVVEDVVGAAVAQESEPMTLQQSPAEIKVPVNPELHLQSERASAPVLSVVNKLLLTSVLELSGQSVHGCAPASCLNVPSGHAVQASFAPVYPDGHSAAAASSQCPQDGRFVGASISLHMQTICLESLFVSLHVAALKPEAPRKSVSVTDVSLPQAASTFRLLLVDMRARRHVVFPCCLHTLSQHRSSRSLYTHDDWPATGLSTCVAAHVHAPPFGTVA